MIGHRRTEPATAASGAVITAEDRNWNVCHINQYRDVQHGRGNVSPRRHCGATTVPWPGVTMDICTISIADAAFREPGLPVILLKPLLGGWKVGIEAVSCTAGLDSSPTSRLLYRERIVVHVGG